MFEWTTPKEFVALQEALNKNSALIFPDNILSYKIIPSSLPSSSTICLQDNLTKLLKDLYKKAYTRNETKPIPPHICYMGLDLNYDGSYLFYSICNLLEQLNLGFCTRSDSVFKNFIKFNSQRRERNDKIESIKFYIEKECFPSGAEEIKEIIFRNQDITHMLFNLSEKSEGQFGSIHGHHLQEDSALRLLIGAFSSGDIDKMIFKKILCLGFSINTEEVNDERLNGWMKKVTNEELKPEPIYTNPLSAYLGGKKILIIEDQLFNNKWNVVLPALFGADCILENNEQRDYIKGASGPELRPSKKHEYFYNSVTISWARDITTAIEVFGQDFTKFDLIFLDLFSSHESFNKEATKDGTLISSVGNNVKDLMKCITSGEKSHPPYAKDPRAEYGQPVSQPHPKIIVFSADTSGLTTRTMLKEVGCTDFFFKGAFNDSHKSAFYATFRNTIIDAIKEQIFDTIHLSHPDGRLHFQKWFSQFENCHRPYILRFLEKFRYYTASNIVHAFDKSLNEAYAINSLEQDSINRIWFSYLGRANKSNPAATTLLAKTNWLHKVRQKCENNRNKMPKIFDYNGLIKELISEFSTDMEEKPIRVILIDDVIFSGGQLEDYASKIFNKISSKFEIEKIIKDRIININETSREVVEEITKTVLKTIHEAGEDFKNRIYESLEIVLPANSGSVMNDLDGFIKIILQIVSPVRDEVLEKFRKALTGKNNMGGPTKVEFESLFALGGKNDWFCEHFFGSNSQQKKEEYRTKTILLKEEITIPGKDTKLPITLTIAEFMDNIEDLFTQMKDSKGNNLWEHFYTILEYYESIITELKKEQADHEISGWKRCSGRFSTYANSPGNTLPIIWSDKSWYPLFPRLFNPWA